MMQVPIAPANPPEEPVEYVDPKRCLLIQWGKLHVRDGQPACPKCGAEAENIIAFMGRPGWAHKIVQSDIAATINEQERANEKSVS